MTPPSPMNKHRGSTLDEFLAEQHPADVVEAVALAICDVIWPLQEWDGDHGVCEAASRLAAEQAITALEQHRPPAGEEAEPSEAMFKAAAEAVGCPLSGEVGPRNREFFTQIYRAMKQADRHADLIPASRS